jgi:hypothetical protein
MWWRRPQLMDWILIACAVLALAALAISLGVPH